MNVPRETIAGVVRQLKVRGYVADALRAGLKTVHRVHVTQDNSLVQPGNFAGLDLESGRARHIPAVPEIRARCRFESGSTRVVTVSPIVRVGDLFWMRTGHMGRANSPITLEVLSVGVARIQDMNDGAALSEGAALLPHKFRLSSFPNGSELTPRDWFAAYWDTTTGGRNARNIRARWASNPWVWMYVWKIWRQGVDAVLAERRA